MEGNGRVIESKSFYIAGRPCDLDLAVGHSQRQTGVPFLPWKRREDGRRNHSADRLVVWQREVSVDTRRCGAYEVDVAYGLIYRRVQKFARPRRLRSRTPREEHRDHYDNAPWRLWQLQGHPESTLDEPG